MYHIFYLHILWLKSPSHYYSPTLKRMKKNTGKDEFPKTLILAINILSTQQFRNDKDNRQNKRENKSNQNSTKTIKNERTTSKNDNMPLGIIFKPKHIEIIFGLQE